MRNAQENAQNTQTIFFILFLNQKKKKIGKKKRKEFHFLLIGAFTLFNGKKFDVHKFYWCMCVFGEIASNSFHFNSICRQSKKKAKS